MGGENIPWTTYVKYLGEIIDNRLTYMKHVEDIQNKIRGFKNEL